MKGDRRFSRVPSVAAAVFGLALLGGVPSSHAVMDATTECLTTFADVPDADKNGGVIQCTDCDPNCDADGVNSANGSCTFKLKVCANEADGSCTATELKRVTVKGRCGASALAPVPSGAAPSCGAEAGLAVKLTKRGKKPGKCKITAKAISSSKPRRIDKDALTLVCNPRPAGQACPTTTSCTVPGNVTCQPIVPGHGIPGTYQLVSTKGSYICQQSATQNRFGTCGPCPGGDSLCADPAHCGPGQQTCILSPFAVADSQPLAFPPGSITTVFTVPAEDPAPSCNHPLCVACGNPDAPCAGIVDCQKAGNPSNCIRQTCCDAPGFTIPTFFVNLLGGLCSRLDMYRCGFGVVNTSKPQVGDNEVTKLGDTSDPGPDCEYGTADDPPKKPCTATGAGGDTKGKVVRHVGNGVCDPDGIHYRVSVPSVSTTWNDGQSPQGTCAPGSIFDHDELLVSQLLLNAEFTTAGATSGFVDMNGDGCALFGAGFTKNNDAGPYTIGSPPAAPQPYDGSSGSVAVAAGIALTSPGPGKGPLFDVGFVAVLPNEAIKALPAQTCTCDQVPGCPE